MGDADEETQYWTLAEYFVEGCQPEKTRPWVLCLVSALQNCASGRRLMNCWKVIDAWFIKQPIVQALPCPQEVALACAVSLLAYCFFVSGALF